MSAVCSCGVDGCMELGWPHEWDPIAAGDSCSIVPPPYMLVNGLSLFPEQQAHKVTEPYEKWGSGYSCVGCIEIHSVVAP